VHGTLGRLDRQRGRALLQDACTKGYWCNEAVDLALEDGDVASAEKTADAGCTGVAGWLFCPSVEKIERKDPAWARAEYARVCATARLPSTKRWACEHDTKAHPAARRRAP
jgi:hypothetical protein